MMEMDGWMDGWFDWKNKSKIGHVSRNNRRSKGALSTAHSPGDWRPIQANCVSLFTTFRTCKTNTCTNTTPALQLDSTPLSRTSHGNCLLWRSRMFSQWVHEPRDTPWVSGLPRQFGMEATLGVGFTSFTSNELFAYLRPTFDPSKFVVSECAGECEVFCFV